MTNAIETIARYMRTNSVVAYDSLQTEFATLRTTVRRWRENRSDYRDMPVTDAHLVSWKAVRGMASSELIRHPKAGPAWLELAREAIKGY